MILDASLISDWRGPARCDNSSPNCLEIGSYAGNIAIRSSADPAGIAITASHAELNEFLEAAKAGEFDYLVS